jgi:hypothetical protein
MWDSTTLETRGKGGLFLLSYKAENDEKSALLIMVPEKQDNIIKTAEICHVEHFTG